MLAATDIRNGNVLRIDGKPCKVISYEVRGTGKFGKTIHLKLKNLEDGHMVEKSFRAEDKAEDLELHHAKMQYLYREGEQFIFMNMETYEQLPISAKAVGQQKVFLKENEEIMVFFLEDKPISIDFPKVVELNVTSAPPGVKGQTDTTYKEVELENGLKILVPQFIKEGERVRVNVDDLTYVDRVTVKSLSTGRYDDKEKEKEKEKAKEK